MVSLQGKSVIVTGAGNGLGEAYACACADAGASVVVNDLDADAAERVAREIVGRGGAAVAVGGSVAVSEEARALVDRCQAEFGQVSAIVNNAGIYHVKPIWEESESSLHAMFAVNVLGTFNVTRAAVDVMKEQRSGSIINVTSGAQSGIWGSSVYAATKGGISSMTYALALELAPYNVRVNAISPNGRSKSSVRQSGWDVEANAPVVVFLISDAAARVTGQVLRVEGPSMSLVSHPRPIHYVVAPEGWTPQSIADSFPKTFEQWLEPVGVGQNRYIYADGLEQAPAPRDIRST
ncbi:MAG: SDR family NAD(P)-dependent oxidoreductase [Acidimicrobiia bacterium]